MHVFALDQNKLVFFGGTFHRPAVVLILQRVPPRHGADLFPTVPQKLLLFRAVFAVVRNLDDRTTFGKLNVLAIAAVRLRVIAATISVAAQFNGMTEGRGHTEARDLVAPPRRSPAAVVGLHVTEQP